MSALDKLNQRQQMFCREYIIDFNGTRAAIDAGYSKKSARRTAHENLTKHNIQKAIAELVQARNDQLETDAYWVAKRLRDELDADINDILDEDGELKDPEEWPLVWRRMISSVKVIKRTDEDGNVTVTREVRKNENPRRLELLGKHVDVQAFRDRIQVEEGNDIEAMKAAQERAEAAKAEEEQDDWEKQNDIEQAEEETESSTFADDLEAAQEMALEADSYDDEGDITGGLEHDFDPNE